MNTEEAARLLSMLSALDRRVLGAETAQAWAWSLEDVPLELATEAAREVRRRGDYVDDAAIRTALPGLKRRLEREARSAAARGIVPKDWPIDRPLPVEARVRLHAAWEREDAAYSDRPEDYHAEVDAPVATPEQIRKALAIPLKSPDAA